MVGFHRRGQRSGITCTSAILIGRKIALILAFASKALREICEDEEQAERRLGKKVAESLKHRLGDLEAAPAATDLIAGRPQFAKRNRQLFRETYGWILPGVCREPCEEPS